MDADLRRVLAELDALEAKATAGPWKGIPAKIGIGSLYGPDCLIYTAPYHSDCIKDTHDRQRADLKFIAALRNHYKLLRDALRKEADRDL